MMLEATHVALHSSVLNSWGPSQSLALSWVTHLSATFTCPVGNSSAVVVAPWGRGCPSLALGSLGAIGPVGLIAPGW